MIDSEGICFASYVVFLLHSLSETSFDQFCNEMRLLSTALFNCKNCCELQIHSHDKVQTELFRAMERDSMEVKRLFLLFCILSRRQRKSRFCPSLWNKMVSSIVACGNYKILLRKLCQIILNWENGKIAWELNSRAMWKADFDMFWIQLE